MEAVQTDTDQYEQFLQFYSQDRDRIFACIHSLLPHRADAEDVFQRCSIVLWRKFAEYESSRSFLAWACGVAFYEVRNFQRVAARDRLQFDGELMNQLMERRLDSAGDVDERFEALQVCIQSLRQADRELMRQAYEEGESLRAFAETTGQALQTLYNRLSQLRRRLFVCVERRLGAEGGVT